LDSRSVAEWVAVCRHLLATDPEFAPLRAFIQRYLEAD